MLMNVWLILQSGHLRTVSDRQAPTRIGHSTAQSNQGEPRSVERGSYEKENPAGAGF